MPGRRSPSFLDDVPFDQRASPVTRTIDYCRQSADFVDHLSLRAFVASNARPLITAARKEDAIASLSSVLLRVADYRMLDITRFVRALGRYHAPSPDVRRRCMPMSTTKHSRAQLDEALAHMEARDILSGGWSQRVLSARHGEVKRKRASRRRRCSRTPLKFIFTTLLPSQMRFAAVDEFNGHPMEPASKRRFYDETSIQKL